MTRRESLAFTTRTFLGACLALSLPASCAQQAPSAPAPDPTTAPNIDTEAAAIPAPDPGALQGVWQQEVDSETVTVTIAGDSLYFHQREDHQYDTTFELIPGSHPAELHATIVEGPRTTSHPGERVVAIYEFVGEKLRLAAVSKPDGEPGRFEDASNDYLLKRVAAAAEPVR